MADVRTMGNVVALPQASYKTLQLTDYHLSKTIIGMLTLYVLSSNRAVRRSHLMNLSTLINTYDPKGYERDNEKAEMVSFIQKGLDARLNYNLNDPQLILYHINGNITDEDDIANYRELSTSDIEWLNKMISETIKQAHVYHETDAMMDICSRFQSAAPGADKAAIAKEFEEEVQQIQNSFRRNKNETVEDEIFSLHEDYFETRIRETYAELTNPKRKLMLGNQALNELFGGGLEETRVYTLLGLPGEGKSMTLLNMAMMIKRYNKNIKTKDPTKRPAVVILTMENRIAETIARMFNISIKRNTKMIEYTVDDVMRQMREEGKLVITPDDPIDIIVKFKPAKSVDTSYLYTLTEDLEDMGVECICMIQDYIGRIRSVERTGDIRIEFGNIVDEFKIFAAAKQIPVLTAGQLNRDASKHIDDGRKQNKSDLVRLLGRSNVSESIMILNNSDGAFIITPEKTYSGEQYIGIQRVKKRFDATEQEWYYIPCYPNTLTMIDDIGNPPNAKITLKDPNQVGNDMGRYNANPTRDMVDFEKEDDFATSVSFHGTVVKSYSEFDEAVAAYNRHMFNIVADVAKYTAYNPDGYYPFVRTPFL